MKALRKLNSIAFALAVAGPGVLHAQTTVFSDNFSSSTLNSASPAAPTATATDYAIASSKNASGSSLNPGSLNIFTPATSSGFTEAQSRFALTPISLAAPGDFITLTAVFAVTNVNLSGNATINFGLYDSGGVNPVPGGALASSALGTSSSSYASGYAAGWKGYVGRIGTGSGATSMLMTRPTQNDTTNEGQDLLFNDAGTGAYDTPTGATIGATTSAGAVLVTGNQYTYTLRLTRNGTGLLVADQNLYAGAGTGGANLFTQTGTTTVGSTITTQFDGLAIGYRAISGSAAIALNVSSLAITVPEPGVCSLVLAGAGVFLAFRRTRRH